MPFCVPPSLLAPGCSPAARKPSGLPYPRRLCTKKKRHPGEAPGVEMGGFTANRHRRGAQNLKSDDDPAVDISGRLFIEIITVKFRYLDSSCRDAYLVIYH